MPADLVANSRLPSAPTPSIPIGLSTASVYPQGTEAAFAYAAELGYDGVELMVWVESTSQDIVEVAALSMRYDMPVLSVHAPCLLLSQRVWGSDPMPKVARAVAAAEDLDAGTVVLHPPFRWQRKYASGFSELIAALEDDSDVAIAVENMFPLRLDRFLRGERSVNAFAPSPDPTDVGFAHYTLDLSHSATAGDDALAMLDRMGDRLTHLHLADGTGRPTDEHLIPGRGTQPCAEVCRRVAASGFRGSVILEVATGSAKDKTERAAMLAEALAFARTHLTTPDMLEGAADEGTAPWEHPQADA